MNLKSLFTKLPPLAQDVAVTFKGYQNYRSRFGSEPGISPILTEKDMQIAKDYQRKKLQEIMIYACKYVPFYQSLNIELNDLERGDPYQLIKRFPVIFKEEILSKKEKFHVPQNKQLKKLFTSGSTGTPLEVFYSDSARKTNYAFYEMVLNTQGCTYKDRSVTFAGRDFIGSSNVKRYWCKDYYSNTMLMSSYNISALTADQYINAISNWQPKYIDSYPSAIASISKFILEKGVRLKSYPKFVLTSSETLSDSDRELIERAFNCKVVDQYGCTEMSVMAYETERGYFFDPRYSFITLSKSSESVYEIICTGLINESMPLINYCIGDSVELGDNDDFEDTCTVNRIIGRSDDLIKLPDGRVIGRIDPMFKGVEGIRRAQVVQEKIDQIVFYIEEVIDGSFDERQKKALNDNVVSRIGGSVNIEYNVITKIDLSTNGKFRSVVSKI